MAPDIKPPMKDIIGVMITEPTPKNTESKPLMLVPGIVDGGIDANMAPKNKAKIIPIIRPIAAEMQAYIIAKGITGIDCIVFSSMRNTGNFYRLSFVIKIFLKATFCYMLC